MSIERLMIDFMLSFSQEFVRWLQTGMLFDLRMIQSRRVSRSNAAKWLSESNRVEPVLLDAAGSWELKKGGEVGRKG